MARFQRFIVGTFVCCCLAAAGCGTSDQSVGIVSGTITLDGVPVEHGAIQFMPDDGKTPTAGDLFNAGSYSVKVPIGAKTVVINAPKVLGKRKLYDTPDSPVVDTTVESMPARYNASSELHLDVKPGKNEVNYDLSSK